MFTVVIYWRVRGLSCEPNNQLNVLYHPPVIHYYRSKAVVLLWYFVTCFGLRVSVTFHLTCVYIDFSLVWVAGMPPFGDGCSLLRNNVVVILLTILLDATVETAMFARTIILREYIRKSLVAFFLIVMVFECKLYSRFLNLHIYFYS